MAVIPPITAADAVIKLAKKWTASEVRLFIDRLSENEDFAEAIAPGITQGEADELADSVIRLLRRKP